MSRRLQGELDEIRAQPTVSEEEQRSRDLVTKKLQDFSREEETFLQFMVDHGEVAWGLYVLSGCSPETIKSAISKGMSALLILQKHTPGSGYQTLYINPASLKALSFLLKKDPV